MAKIAVRCLNFMLTAIVETVWSVALMDSLSSFDPRGRERYEAIMRQAEYMELEAFFGRADLSHFCCLSCEYMVEQPSSSTGYWCHKVGFPDIPEGCCRFYEPLPELKNPKD